MTAGFSSVRAAGSGTPFYSKTVLRVFPASPILWSPTPCPSQAHKLPPVFSDLPHINPLNILSIYAGKHFGLGIRVQADTLVLTPPARVHNGKSFTISGL